MSDGYQTEHRHLRLSKTWREGQLWQTREDDKKEWRDLPRDYRPGWFMDHQYRLKPGQPVAEEMQRVAFEAFMNKIHLKRSPNFARSASSENDYAFAQIQNAWLVWQHLGG